MTQLAIDLTRVTKRFASNVVLDKVDMGVAKGAVYGFLGANGAGKTTTIRLLLGLLAVDSGEVRVLERNPSREGEIVRRSVGVLLDHDGLYDRLSARQNLEFHAGIRDMSRADAQRDVDELLQAVGLWEHRSERVRVLSKGMRQKLAVARSLLGSPQLLLLDEPFTGLDATAAVDLRDRLCALAKRSGVTILLTTHDLHHVEKICDEVTVLEGGRVVAAGRVDDLRGGSTKNAEVAVLVEGTHLDRALDGLVGDGLISTYKCLSTERALVMCSEGSRFRLATELLRRGVELRELATHRDSLEETFMKLVKPREVTS